MSGSDTIGEGAIDAEVVRRCWDSNAPVWADHVRRGYDVYRELFNNPAFLGFLGDIRGVEALDVGCGEGYNTRIFARLGARMTGVDISGELIELAKAEEEREPLGIRYDRMGFEDMRGLDDASFDLVVSTMALMDGAGYDEGIREIHRVLRPGGTLAFSILHPCFMTEGFSWLRAESGEPEALRVARYFDGSPSIERWKFSNAPALEDAEPFSVPRFPRTLSEIINPLLQAGFVLQQISEPRPDEGACEQCEALRKWRDHAAIFLHVKATKP